MTRESETTEYATRHMPPTTQSTALGRDTQATFDAPTSHSSTLTVRNTVIHVLEMEDVLFHYNSAVMMPRSPEGRSSDDGTADDATSQTDQQTQQQQEMTTGLQALALVFKTIEFYSEYRIIVAGHTDTSGGYAFNYTLADERARGVLLLLLGKENASDPAEEEGQHWAEIAEGRQRIEDYQQIMTHYASTGRVAESCDPQGVDNTWGDNTESACEAFFQQLSPDTADTLIAAVRGHSRHQWPVEAWRLVYDLYAEEVRNALRVDAAGLAAKRATLLMRFANPDHKYVACGESYPVESSERNHYRSQKNRRVEILFIDDDEVPEINCPSDTSRKHRTRLDGPPIECPLWHEFIMRDYLDPNDLTAEAYHMRFVYRNPVTGSLATVPDGLPRIRAFQNNTTEIPTVCSHRNGVYTVRVQYPTPDDPARNSVAFVFEAVGAAPDSRLWIYTQNDSATPRIVELTQAQFDALSLEEQFKHYDLPRRWHSTNFCVRYEKQGGGAVTDADITNGRDRRELCGILLNNTATAGIPQYRPFGDRQTASDHPWVFCLDDILLTDNSFNPVTTAVTDNSALFDAELAVIEPDTANNASYLTRGGLDAFRITRLREILIPFGGRIIRGAVCEYRVYAVFRDRAGNVDHSGHRAMVFRHPDNCELVVRFQQYHYRGFPIGNFDAYLLRNFNFANNEIEAYLLVYVRWHCRDANTNAAYDPAWVNTTVNNILSVWNDVPNNQLVALTGSQGGNNHRVHIRFYLQNVALPNQHTIINVHPAGTPGRSSMGRTSGQVRANQNQADAEGRFTIAHEFGHAVSLDDDYHEKWSNCCYWQRGFPDFKPGAPFDEDDTSMMQSNRTVRTRHFWHYPEWLRSRLIPTATIDLTVNKLGDHAYRIERNPANPWDPSNAATQAQHYCNWPSLINRPASNTVNGRGRFNLYRYPLGADPYSRGGLRAGQNFTATIVLCVNMRFQFWDSASYRQITEVLNDIETSVRENLANPVPVKVCGDAPYQETSIQIQPRYLVNNHTDQYTRLNPDLTSKALYTQEVNNILGRPDGVPHYTVNVSNPLFGTWFTDSEWDSANPNTLNLVRGDADDFWEFFAEMLGMNHGQTLTTANFSVATAVPNGRMVASP